MKTYHIYILKCIDDSYCTGITTDLEKRLNDHLSGRRSSSRGRGPVTLAYSTEFDSISTAVRAELEIKKWTQAQVEALIRWKKRVFGPPVRKASTGHGRPKSEVGSLVVKSVA